MRLLINVEVMLLKKEMTMSEVKLNSNEIAYLIMGLRCAVDYAVLTPESVKNLQSKLNREFRKQYEIKKLQNSHMEYGGDYE